MHQVLRLNKSSYQQSNDLLNEKKAIEDLGDIIYRDAPSQLDLEIPLILITNTHTTALDINALRMHSIKLILHPNSGCDNFTPSFLKNLTCPIIFGNEIRAPAVAEYILHSIFESISKFPRQKSWSRQWKRKLLNQQEIQIFGHGHIG
ncbi:hypothetical protein OAB57_03240, partial [Bacteriovoracaceae bacterium]|nr:hypothetical protein [Bacteriovoracaceae bacterium]